MTAKPEDYTGPSEFVHCHSHTIFSTLDGCVSPHQYAEECGKRGYPAIAITEHGHMASVPDMYFASRKHGVKYIAACEIYFNNYEPIRRQFVQDGGKLKQLGEDDDLLSQRFRRNRHMTILCKNETGLHNLIKLTTLAHEFGFYYAPRIWFDKLREYKEGLIILSGCINGPVAYELRLDAQYLQETGKRAPRLEGRDHTAVQYIKMFQEEFGEDFFLEVQMPCLPELYDYAVFRMLTEYGDRYGIKVVLTNDAHYMTRKDFEVQKVMMAVSQGRTVDDPELFHVNSDEQFMKSRAELWATFKNNKYSKAVSDSQFEEMCDNTLLIAERCEPLELDTNPKIPEWTQVEPGVDADKKLRKIVAAALVRRGLHKNDKKYIIDGREVSYVEQTKIELDRFIDKGFASYFLITQDLLQYGHRQGWPFGPRGCTIPEALIDVCDSGPKMIKDVQIGDEIKDGFGNDQIVENKFAYDVSEELYIFELDDCTIEITGDHKLYIIRNDLVVPLPASEIIDTDEIIGNLPDRIDTDVQNNKGVLLSSQIQNVSELQKLVLAGSVQRLGIKKISRRYYVGKVYDLQVSITNTYRLNGTFSSNSAGGSLVCFLLDIHAINPLKWGLSFDRFMASSRGGYMLNIKL